MFIIPFFPFAFFSIHRIILNFFHRILPSCYVQQRRGGGALHSVYERCTKTCLVPWPAPCPGTRNDQTKKSVQVYYIFPWLVRSLFCVNLAIYFVRVKIRLFVSKKIQPCNIFCGQLNVPHRHFLCYFRRQQRDLEICL